MKTYILSIAGLILVTAVVAVIVPSGKMGKFIRGILKTVTLAVLLAPFVNWAGGGEFSFEGGSLDVDSAYLERCADMISESDEREISLYLKSDFDVTSEVSVERDTNSPFSVKKLHIKISDFGINGEGEHINIVSKIKAALETKYGCVAEVV